jgi:aminoglycoside/choline kinase family phosphotransferase
MRPGLGEYDLASLVFDPYVDLSLEERSGLIAYYRQRQAENAMAIEGRCDEILQFCITQRLMQALGAYGYLGLVKGNKTFLQYIPSAVRSLKNAVANIDGLETLATVLADLSPEYVDSPQTSTLEQPVRAE